MVDATRDLPTPQPDDVRDWVAAHLADVLTDAVSASPIRGGQSAADALLDAFDVTGYAGRRNEVWPSSRRGASGLSPYIRHGLLDLPRVWDHVSGGPERDVRSFRDELLWQEYSRHLYARLGPSTGRSLRFAIAERDHPPHREWPEGMACVDGSVAELRSTGWLTNQQRMWLASHWSVREGWGWRDGEDEFFRHLLDGSRAANRLGWQWTSGALTGKPYGFSRWQVENRAPALCATCALQRTCPIQDWPEAPAPSPRAWVDPTMRRDSDLAGTVGPGTPVVTGAPEAVWLTAESLGDADPALRAWPDLPATFVFDIPLLTRLRLAPQRLVFLAECLADLAQRRTVLIRRGDPARVLDGMGLAVTFAPVPGHRRLSRVLAPRAVHPWPWLVTPHGGPVTSFTAWRRRARV